MDMRVSADDCVFYLELKDSQDRVKDCFVHGIPSSQTQYNAD